MSLERDVTVLMEAEIFKPAGKEELKKRGYTGKEYAIWYGNLLDGVITDRSKALQIYLGSAATIYEIPAGSPPFQSRQNGIKIYPTE